MDWNDFIFATYEIILAIVFSLITIFISKKVLIGTLLNKVKTKAILYENPALALFGGIMLICVLLLVHASLKPAVDTLKVEVMANHELTLNMFVTSFGYFILFFMISLVVSQLLILLTTKVYFMATRNIDEIVEIKNNNIAVAIIISCVILGITLSVKPSLEHFLSSMVNYDQAVELPQAEMEVEEGQTIIFEEEDIK